MAKKRCPRCLKPMQKWGKQNRGSQRYRCPRCKTNAVRQRSDLTQKYRRQLYEKWLLSKLTLSDYGKQYGVDRRAP